MGYKGYEWQSNSRGESRQFNGVRLHLYNNRNGKYCLVEYGKDCNMYYDDLELMDLMLVWAIDSLENAFESIGFCLTKDWVEGFVARGTIGE